MNKNQETKEKVCTFFASDYHFEMITLPYIQKKIKENKDIIILTENNLEDTIKVLISRMNLEEENKNNILKINWNNNDFNKLKKIKYITDENKEAIIFIKGKENYIANINENISKWTDNKENIEIIDCYDLEEINEKLDSVMDKYQKVLSVTGEKEIRKM